MLESHPTPSSSLPTVRYEPSKRPSGRSHPGCFSAGHTQSQAHPAIHPYPVVERRMATARPRLVRLARLQGVDADGAEDVAQETLLEAWRALDALRDPTRF